MANLNIEEKKLIELLKRLWHKLSKKRKIQINLMLVMMIISSFAEIVTLASVVPFLGLLSNPDSFDNFKNLYKSISAFGVNNESEFFIFITLVFIFSAISSGIIRIANIWLNGRLAAAIGSDLSCEAYKRTLYQNYETILEKNSSTLISSLSKEIDKIIVLILNPILQSLTALFIIIGITVSLLLINWYVTLITTFSITLVYLIASLINKKPITRLGSKQVKLQSKLIQNIQEGLGSIKDVILYSSQPVFINIFSKSVNPLRRIEAHVSFLTYYPRLIVEPIGLTIIAILGFSFFKAGNIDAAIPTLGALALGSMRILPMAQRLFEGWSFPQNGKAGLAKVLDLLDQPLNKNNSFLVKDLFQFRKNIKFKNVGFHYANNYSNVISNCSFEIKKGERIGIIGKTGSGKSTIIDLIMGLLKPTNGQIYIDNNDIFQKENLNLLKSWRYSIVHVPQSIYLTDNSIGENIAFGLPKNKIDFARLNLAAKKAQILNYVKNLEYGFDTLVGENGVLLSGGQRQRIGIARALYKKDFDVLILDEATSALDNDTEEKIINSIKNMQIGITIIMIAHRKRTLKNCDKIFEVKDNRLLINSG